MPDFHMPDSWYEPPEDGPLLDEDGHVIPCVICGAAAIEDTGSEDFPFVCEDHLEEAHDGQED